MENSPPKKKLFVRLVKTAGGFQACVFLPAILCAVGSMDWSKSEQQPTHFTAYFLRAVFLGLAFMGTVYLVDSRLTRNIKAERGRKGNLIRLTYLSCGVAVATYFSLKQTHFGQPQILAEPLEALEAILRIFIIAVIFQTLWLVYFRKPSIWRALQEANQEGVPKESGQEL